MSRKKVMETEGTNRVSHLQLTLGKTAVRVLDWISIPVIVLVMWVGTMQSQNVNGGWVTNYGADIIGPISFWWCTRRTIFASVKFGAEIAILVQLVGCFVWEFCQRFDLSNTVLFFTKGTFDPLDLVTYSATLMACYSLDKYLQFRQRRRVNLSSN